MKKKSDLQQLSANLQDVFGSKNWHLLWQTYTLVRHWPEVAGETVAEKSIPAYIQNNTLWIYVNDSVWMQHLHSQKTLLLDKVRNFTGGRGIDDIRWLLHPDGTGVEQNRPGERRRRKIDPAEQKKFEKTASSVKNEHCRAALCNLWRIYHGME